MKLQKEKNIDYYCTVFFGCILGININLVLLLLCFMSKYLVNDSKLGGISGSLFT